MKFHQQQPHETHNTEPEPATIRILDLVFLQWVVWLVGRLGGLVVGLGGFQLEDLDMQIQIKLNEPRVPHRRQSGFGAFSNASRLSSLAAEYGSLTIINNSYISA